MTKSNRRSWASGVAAGTLFVAAPAASDIKAYYGGICFPSYEAGKAEYSYRGTKAMHSSSEDIQTYMCPLVRDHLGSGSSLNQVSIELHKTSSQETECVVLTLSEDGNSGAEGNYIVDSQWDAVTGTGLKQLDFFDLTTAGGNEGGYVVECYLRRGDTLLHIHTEED